LFEVYHVGVATCEVMGIRSRTGDGRLLFLFFSFLPCWERNTSSTWRAPWTR